MSQPISSLRVNRGIIRDLEAAGYTSVEQLKGLTIGDLTDISGIGISSIRELEVAMSHQFETAHEMNCRIEAELDTKARLGAQRKERRAELLRVATDLATGSLATATRLNIAPHIPNIVKQSVVMAQALIDTVDEEVNQ